MSTSHFYPRSPCGERRCISRKQPVQAAFLSTLSLRRATYHNNKLLSTITHFYPRSPCGERLFSTAVLCYNVTFLSTLSLRRATAVPHLPVAPVPHFYPRSPCGERLRFFLEIYVLFEISIHALLAESDLDNLMFSTPCWSFLSTLSLRRATRARAAEGASARYFYPRSPCGERHAMRT